MKTFEELLQTSAAAHGHLCPGQVVGVRMALLGCRLIGLDDPSSHDQIKKLIVFAEIDRCTADAVAHVTVETDKAYLVLSTEEARSLAPLYAPEIDGKHHQQLEAYQRMPDSVLFRVQRVRVPLDEFDLPGPTRRRVPCARCGQIVRDHREVLKDGVPLCRPCAQGVYFKDATEITWPDMNWAPSPFDMGTERPAQTGSTSV